jgi:hypothetical protein
VQHWRSGKEIGVVHPLVTKSFGIASAASACCVIPDVAFASEAGMMAEVPLPAAAPLLAGALCGIAYLTRRRPER